MKRSLPEIPTVINANRAKLMKPGVLSVRPGFKFTNGWITHTPAIVATVKKKKAADQLSAADVLPTEVDGTPVDVIQATADQRKVQTDPASFVPVATSRMAERRPTILPHTVLANGQDLGTEVEAAMTAAKAHAPALERIKYTSPPDVPLTPVDEDVTITVAASPDAGWVVLSAFLAATKKTLTVGLYDCTSTHVTKALVSALGKTAKLNLVLDRPVLNPTANQFPETTVSTLSAALGTRLSFAWALDGLDHHASEEIYPTAYHIKVAVRDSNTVWLSSGNWNNSNQPELSTADADWPSSRDRDWHVVIEHAGLAGTFEKYIAHDLAIAQVNNKDAPPQGTLHASPKPGAAIPNATAHQTFTKKMKITPLLTPDLGDYINAIEALIGNTNQSLRMQFQYIHIGRNPPANFLALIQSVVDAQARHVDVKIIVRDEGGDLAAQLDLLQQHGIDVTGNVRTQVNVHNKGIVSDDKTVLVSSQNWSSEGVLQNRDAGVLLEDPDVAAYFAGIFDDDWANRARPHVSSL